MIFPTFGQFATHHQTQALAILRMSLCILLNQRLPLIFELLAAWHRFTEVRERFLRNVELLVFRPAEMSLRFAHCVLARCIAVSLARALSRHSEADDCLHRNQAWLIS